MKKSSRALMLGTFVLFEITCAKAQQVEPAQSQLDEIIITAQRRSENLQNVPITVNALSADLANASGISSTRDLALVIPGLQYRSTVGNANPYLRGVGTSATGAGNEPPVATYIDGVYIATAPGALLSLNNIERIEVLKGPQGTLFGRNATGGLVQIITRSPSSVPSGDFSLGYGNYGTINGQGYFTGKIAGSLTGDVAVYFNDQTSGWGRNLTTGQDVNKERDTSFRSKLLYDLGDDSDLTFIADYSTVKGTIGVALRSLQGSLPIVGIPYSGGFYDVTSDQQPSLATSTGGVSLQAHINLEWANFVSISSYRGTRSNQTFDQDATLVPLINLSLDQREHDFAQELQLLSPSSSSKLSWIVGAFFFNQEAGFYPLAVYGPVLGPARFSNTTDEQHTNSISGYGQATYEIVPSTNLTAGLRYSYDWRRLTGHNATFFGPNPDVPVEIADVGQPSWRLSLDHKLEDETLLYASYNRGFKSGVFNTGGGGLGSPALKPEKLDAYEIGFKSRFDRYQLNTSGFYYNYTNIQVIRTDQGLQQLLSADAKICGLDVDGIARVMDGLNLRTGLELLHGRYHSFTPYDVITTPLPSGGASQAPGSGRGKTTINSPPLTFDIAADYAVPSFIGDFGFNLTYYYNNGYYPDPDNRVRAGAYNIVNAQVTLKPVHTSYTVRMWAKNLTQTHYYEDITESTLGDDVAVAAPRTYGASFQWSF